MYTWSHRPYLTRDIELADYPVLVDVDMQADTWLWPNKSHLIEHRSWTDCLLLSCEFLHSAGGAVEIWGL
jgi:hypothetical protein